jgi:hemerythrin
MTYRHTTWTSDLETGNVIIDKQHQQLIAALNALFDAYKNGKGQHEVERTMEFLAGYAIKHLADEEALQQKYNYPEYPAHKQIHIDFKKVVQGLVTRLSQDGPTDEFISEVYVTIAEWLVNHIKGDDFRMAAYIQSKGASL